MSRWFRFYTNSIHDPKILRLSDAIYRAWTTLLCFAAENDGMLPSVPDIAASLRIKETTVAAWITELVSRELIDAVENGFSPHNWDVRQYKSDVTDTTASERMRRYRGNKGSVTGSSRNAAVTVTDGSPVTVTHDDRNAAVTVTVTRDRDRDRTETEEVKARAPDEKLLGDFRQAIVREYEAAKSPTIPDTERARLWLAKGFEPDICLGVISSILPRKPSAALAYFDNAIAEAMASKVPKRIPVNLDPFKPDWEAACKLWTSVRRWPRRHGNDPESESCRCPREILVKHGIIQVAA